MNMLPKDWTKSNFWEPFIVPAIVVLVGISAFALGRLSALAGSAAPLYEQAP